MNVPSGIINALDQHYVKLFSVECGLSVPWLSCWGQGSRASLRFGQQPPPGLEQQVSLSPLLGLSCGSAVACGCSELQLGWALECWNAQFHQGSWQALVSHAGVESSELWRVSSVSSWHPEGRPRAGHGLGSLWGGLNTGSCLGQAEQ